MRLGRFQTGAESQSVGNAGRNFQNLAGHSDEIGRCADHRKLKRGKPVLLASEIDPHHRAIAHSFGQCDFRDVKFRLQAVLDQIRHRSPHGCYSTLGVCAVSHSGTEQKGTLGIQFVRVSRTRERLWITRLQLQLRLAFVNSVSPALALLRRPTDGRQYSTVGSAGRPLAARLGEAARIHQTTMPLCVAHAIASAPTSTASTAAINSAIPISDFVQGMLRHSGEFRCVEYRGAGRFSRLKAPEHRFGIPNNRSAQSWETLQGCFGRIKRRLTLRPSPDAANAPRKCISRAIGNGRAMRSPPWSQKSCTATVRAISRSNRNSPRLKALLPTQRNR